VAESGEKLPLPDEANGPVPLARAGAILAAIGFTWCVVSYFPHSNIPTVLPTVRAERFWYFPAIGTSLALAAAFAWFHHSLKKTPIPYSAGILIAAFFGFQSVQAYRHAMDYRNDLVFWEATRNAVPLSAKAHLNYSVMAGARGQMETRLRESRIAIQLAPKWAMAHIYTGDTLCRMHRAEEAWPYYSKGFDLGPNEMSLIALALQCLYDEKQLYAHEDELRELARSHPDSWIAYLANDTLTHSETHKGVDPKYRPRGYNEGPKE
jgi:tetratricopeptide (TPR) repeat protein